MSINPRPIVPLMSFAVLDATDLSSAMRVDVFDPYTSFLVWMMQR